MFKFIILIFLLLPVTSYLTPYAFAQEMNSQNFKLQGGNFNMTSGNKSSANFKLSDVVGQNASIVFASKGYVIQSGFLNTAAATAFGFSVSPPIIDFGILTPDSPVLRQATIKISNGNVPGYTVKVSENQPPSTNANATIPDTLCDGVPNNVCSPKKAANWTNLLAYGFGYRMDGKTVPKEFIKDGVFRSYSASTRKEGPEIIMQTQARKVVDTATMTLKINVGRAQPVGQYHNVISFVALAGI